MGSDTYFLVVRKPLYLPIWGRSRPTPYEAIALLNLSEADAERVRSQVVDERKSFDLTFPGLEIHLASDVKAEEELKYARRPCGCEWPAARERAATGRM